MQIWRFGKMLIIGGLMLTAIINDNPMAIVVIASAVVVCRILDEV